MVNPNTEEANPPQTPTRVPSSMHTYSIFPPTPTTPHSQVSQSSVASKSTQNTTGTEIHHKSRSPRGDTNATAARGLRRGSDRRKNAKRIDHEFADNVYDRQDGEPSPKVLEKNNSTHTPPAHDRRIASRSNTIGSTETARGSRATHREPGSFAPAMREPQYIQRRDGSYRTRGGEPRLGFNTGAMGYEKGQYVTKMGTAEQNDEITMRIQEARRKSRPWWKRMFD